MTISIYAGGLKATDYSSAQTGTGTGKNTVFAGATNLMNDPIAQKRAEAQKKAMKVVSDAWDSDKSVAEHIQSRKDHYAEMESLRTGLQDTLKDTNDDAAALKALYEVKDDSKEQQDLELMKKRQDWVNGVTRESPTKEELERLAEIDKQPMTEYQSRALEINGRAGELKKRIEDTDKQMQDDIGDVKSILLEKLKSNPMVDAEKAADVIMGAANDEIIGMLVQEATEHIEEKSEESKEDAEKAAKKKEEKDEQLEEIKEKQAIEQAFIEGTKQAAEEAKREHQKNEAPDVELDEILDMVMKKPAASEVSESLDEIKYSMNLLEADLKGIQVDEEI